VLAHDSWQRLKRGRLVAAAVMAYKLAANEHTLPHSCAATCRSHCVIQLTCSRSTCSVHLKCTSAIRWLLDPLPVLRSTQTCSSSGCSWATQYSRRKQPPSKHHPQGLLCRGHDPHQSCRRSHSRASGNTCLLLTCLLTSFVWQTRSRGSQH
jgi:hypothetical protein